MLNSSFSWVGLPCPLWKKPNRTTDLLQYVSLIFTDSALLCNFLLGVADYSSSSQKTESLKALFALLSQDFWNKIKRRWKRLWILKNQVRIPEAVTVLNAKDKASLFIILMKYGFLGFFCKDGFYVCCKKKVQ